MSCCGHCHWHHWGYPYAAASPAYPPAYYAPPPPPPPRARGADELGTLLQDLQEELATIRREIDELRRSGTAQR
jgi:hypothetical protein